MTRRSDWAEAPRTVSIVHDIPGRLRLRLPPGAAVDGVKEAIDGANGVLGSAWSPRTRSLLVRYDPNLITAADITRAVAEHAELDAPVPRDESHGADNRPVVSAILDVFQGLNQRVERGTRGRLDLGVLIPIALVLWAGRQLLRGPVTSLSWTSALWYAHGLFRDYTARER